MEAITIYIYILSGVVNSWLNILWFAEFLLVLLYLLYLFKLWFTLTLSQ